MSAAVPAPVHGLRLGEHPEPHAVWSLEEAAWIEQRDQQWRLWAESAAPAPAAHPRQLVSVSSIDVERLIAECLPGGSVCDPQAVADNIRRYCNAWPGAAPAAQPLTEAPAELRGLDTASRVRFYEHDFYVLSNFSAFTLYWRGLRFDTSEAAYHFEKFTDSDGAMADVAAIRHAILKAPSAHEAFKIAEHNKAHRRPDWDDVKVGIMLDILRAKGLPERRIVVHATRNALLPLVTTHGERLLKHSVDEMASIIRAALPGAQPEDVRAYSDTMVRMMISHAILPSPSTEDSVDSMLRVALPLLRLIMFLMDAPGRVGLAHAC